MSSLVLTRRIGETICIGPDVEVIIISMNGHQVRLAITAPRSVSIDRKEIRLRKDAEKAPTP